MSFSRLTHPTANNPITRGLDAIPDDAINPVLLRSEILSEYARGTKPLEKPVTIALASVSEGGDTNYFIAFSGAPQGKKSPLKSPAPETITLSNGITYKVILEDSQVFPPVTYDGGKTNFRHAEQKLANYIYSNYSGSANVNMSIQNVSKEAGMCNGCRQNMPTISASNQNINLYIFEGTTGTGR